MASKKISVNLSGPKTLKGASSKNIGERTPLELIPTNASSDKKLISDWKSSKEVKFPSRAWYVKERESTTVNIYLYIDTPHNNEKLEVMGKVMDMCWYQTLKLFTYLQKLPSHMKGLNTDYHIHYMTRERYLQSCVNKS